MAFVVAAIWKAKPGEEERIARAIEVMTPLSRAEDKCLFYQAHRTPDDPRTFFLYEQYVDESGYEEHMASPHFQEHVREGAIPYLEDRERAFYHTMDL
ncbi:MAG: antibiotic biosynthesis monooxygenase [Streptosporangiales bacterium]|nr:antibiotic biosynthesis monooxygenase [Streptosporangiales bacterium]